MYDALQHVCGIDLQWLREIFAHYWLYRHINYLTDMVNNASLGNKYVPILFVATVNNGTFYGTSTVIYTYHLRKTL